MTVPLRGRLAVTFTLGFAVLLVGGAGILYGIQRRGYREDYDIELRNLAHAAQDLFVIDRGEYPTSAGTVAHIVTELIFGERTIVAFDSLGRRIAVSQHLAGSPDLDHVDPFTVPGVPTDLRVAGQDLRVMTVPLPDDAYFLLLGQYNDAYRGRLRTLLLAYTGGLPILLALGGLVGMILARPALQPVHRMIDDAERAGEAVTRGDHPIPRLARPPADDEILRVAEAINHLLERLEGALTRERDLTERQRAFLADAAHELRTPVAVLRSELDAWKAGGAGEMSALVGTFSRETDRLTRLVEDLLFLARTSELPAPALEPLFLDDVAQRALTRARRLPARHEGAGIVLGEFEAAPALGDAVLLERALVVLLDNALRHGGPGEITLEAGGDEEVAWVSVRDRGAGVPAEVRERIFERFVRCDPAGDGAGLGLAIARWIAEVHGGAVHVEDAGPGARFTLRIPRRTTRGTA